MQALIFAAGLGTRMRPLTNTTPKPLLKILQKPILEYNLEAVHDLIDEIIIVIGYKGDMIKEYFKDNFKGTPIKYAEEKELLGTGHALLCAQHLIKDKFLIMLGDDYITKQVIQKALQHDLCVVATKVEHPERFGILEVDNNNLIKGLEEKPQQPKSNLANIGLWVMNKKLVHLMKQQPKSPRGEYEITDALKALVKTDKVYCETIINGWIPIGYPDDLKKVETFLKQK